MSHSSRDEAAGHYSRLRDYNELEDGLVHHPGGGGGHHLPHHHGGAQSAASSPGRTSVPGGLLGIPPVRPFFGGGSGGQQEQQQQQYGGGAAAGAGGGGSGSYAHFGAGGLGLAPSTTASSSVISAAAPLGGGGSSGLRGAGGGGGSHHGGVGGGPGGKGGKKGQKKGRKMAWLIIHNSGEAQTVHMDKRQLVQVMGLEIPMRDLRLMDPALAAWESFAQILVRDNALVVSAEYVRIIITADKVIFPLDFEKTEQSERFKKTVETVIKERPDCVPHLGSGGGAGAGGGRGGDGLLSPPAAMPIPHASSGGAGDPASPSAAAAAATHARLLSRHHSGGAMGGGGGGMGGGGGGSGPYSLKDPELLPFELNMLEVALGEITRHYAQQTASLEALAHPALDALMRNCNSVNLERVRKIKTQHQRLQGRLQGLREVMERYMEDDQDMYRMCLSKLREQDLGEGAGSDNTLLLGRPGGLSAGLLAQGSLPRNRVASLARSPPGFMERFQGMPRRDRGDDSSSSSSASGASIHDLLEVENLLESYFMMVDGTLAKLSGIGEYIDDTEDYINIELDYNRNRLLRIEILLTVATFALAIYNLVAGILGENLVLPEAWTADLRGFIVINAGTLTLCVLTFFVTWRVMVAKKLI